VKIPRIKINPNFDWSLIIIPVILGICSLATLYSISSVSGNLSLVTSQAVFFAIGIVVYIIFAMFDYRETKNYVWYLYAIGLLMLIIVDFVGIRIFGSSRWIDLGFFQIQPSELMKIFLLIFAASYFSNKENLKPLRILFFAVVSIVPVYLVLREPDLGTALTTTVMLITVLLVVGIPRKYLFIGAAAIILASPLIWISLKPYQKERVVSFANPSLDPLGSGYNVSQSKIAVGSGGLMGKGFGNATQSQLRFLPIAQIDFIFSGWAEATGFVGSIVLVLAFGILIARIFIVSSLSRDKFGMIFASGVGAVILFQAFVNIGMNIGIMPVTGIPLPFVSAGGTSFITNAVLLGMTQSIYLRRRGLKFE